MTLYLRTETRAQMDAALAAAGIPAEGADWVAVDHIGQVVAIEGDVATIVDARHHANVLFRHPPSQDVVNSLPTIPEPSSPCRQFA